MPNLSPESAVLCVEVQLGAVLNVLLEPRCLKQQIAGESHARG
jgi:hypothetical protein